MLKFCGGRLEDNLSQISDLKRWVLTFLITALLVAGIVYLGWFFGVSFIVASVAALICSVFLKRKLGLIIRSVSKEENQKRRLGLILRKYFIFSCSVSLFIVSTYLIFIMFFKWQPIESSGFDKILLHFTEATFLSENKIVPSLYDQVFLMVEISIFLLFSATFFFSIGSYLTIAEFICYLNVFDGDSYYPVRRAFYSEIPGMLLTFSIIMMGLLTLPAIVGANFLVYEYVPYIFLTSSGMSLINITAAITITSILK